MCINPILDSDNTWSVGNVPSTNSWVRGQRVYIGIPSATGYMGYVTVQAGTMGTLNSGATSGTIASGSDQLTVNSSTGLAVGVYISIAGVTGVKRIMTLNTSTKVATLDSVSDATVSNAAVSFSNAVWKGFSVVQT